MNETVSMEVGVTPPYNFYLNSLVHRKKYPKIKLNFTSKKLLPNTSKKLLPKNIVVVQWRR